MKRLVLFIALIVILTGLSASAASDDGVSITDSNILDNEITTRQALSSNSSASATITITMYTGDDE